MWSRGQGEKRQDEEKGELEGKGENLKYFPIFKRRKLAINETGIEKEEIAENSTSLEEEKETEPQVEEETETEKERKEKERDERIKRAENQKKSWELLKLCKKMIENDGVKWGISKERRLEEKRREEEKE